MSLQLVTMVKPVDVIIGSADVMIVGQFFLKTRRKSLEDRDFLAAAAPVWNALRRLYIRMALSLDMFG